MELPQEYHCYGSSCKHCKSETPVQFVHLNLHEQVEITPDSPTVAGLSGAGLVLITRCYYENVAAAGQTTSDCVVKTRIGRTSMPATPRRTSTSAHTSSPAQSLVGRCVAIPSDIFKEDKQQYTGKVTGTPRRKNAVYVTVDQDNTKYWFPADQVAQWVVGEATSPSTPHKSKSVRSKSRTSAADSGTVASSQQQDTRPDRHLSATSDQRATDSSQQPLAADAASSHPERPEEFTETITGLVSLVDICQ